MKVSAMINTKTVRRYFDGSYIGQVAVYNGDINASVNACVVDADGNFDSDHAFKFEDCRWGIVSLKPSYQRVIAKKFKSLIASMGNDFKFVRESDPVVMQKRLSSIRSHLETIADKPARVKKGRDKAYLIRLAQGQRASQPATIFLNPTDDQLDKIFNGDMAGYQ